MISYKTSKSHLWDIEMDGLELWNKYGSTSVSYGSGKFRACVPLMQLEHKPQCETVFSLVPGSKGSD